MHSDSDETYYDVRLLTHKIVLKVTLVALALPRVVLCHQNAAQVYLNTSRSSYLRRLSMDLVQF